jgi:hypothetical protein
MPVGGETPGRVHRRRGGGGHQTEREGRRGRHREDRNRQGAEEGADPTARHDGEETPEQHPLPDASRREKGRPRPPRPPWRADVGRGGKRQPTGEGSRLEHGQQSLVHAPHAHLCKSAAAGGGGCDDGHPRSRSSVPGAQWERTERAGGRHRRQAPAPGKGRARPRGCPGDPEERPRSGGGVGRGRKERRKGREKETRGSRLCGSVAGRCCRRRSGRQRQPTSSAAGRRQSRSPRVALRRALTSSLLLHAVDDEGFR